MVEQQAAVQVQAHAIIGRGLDAVAARHRRQQLAAPADAEVVGRHALAGPGFAARHQVVGGRATIPAESDLRIHAHQCRRARQVAVAEIFAAQAALAAIRSRAQVLRFDQRRRGGIFAPFDQVDAARVHHLDLRRGLADALQDGHRRRRGAVVVAQQGHGVVGGGADHGDAAQLARQRQHAVVLQQHHRFLRGLARQRVVLRRLVGGVRECAPSAPSPAGRTCPGACAR